MVSIGDNHSLVDTASVSSLESDESLLTPAGGPRVLDDIVFSSVSDGKDGMIEASSAVLEDSLLVVLPVGSIDSDGDGASLESANQT